MDKNNNRDYKATSEQDFAVLGNILALRKPLEWFT